MTFEDTKRALKMYYILCSLFVLNLTKVESKKLEISVRIALWVKSKMAATMARVVGSWFAGLHFTM